MKCRECDCCFKGYFASKPNAYVCIGVKEPFIIDDTNVECTEYPEKRNKEIVMNTAEMWLKAQKDGKTYECIDGDIAYSKDMGLVDKWDFNEPWNLEAWKEEEEHGFDCLMECKWQVMDNVMTVEEAEQRFGIKIVRD